MGEGVTLGGEGIAAATVIWAAGVAASQVGQWLDEETDKAGRVVVCPDLSIKKDSTIFVIGDAASVMNEQGEPVPGIAPAAKQQAGSWRTLLPKESLANQPRRLFTTGMPVISRPLDANRRSSSFHAVN